MLTRIYWRFRAHLARRRLKKIRRLAHGSPRDVMLQIAHADALADVLEMELRK